MLVWERDVGGRESREDDHGGYILDVDVDLYLDL